MDKFYAKYQFGKRKRLIDLKEEGTLISGIRVRQYPDYSFTWDMNEYTKDKLRDIEVPRGFLTNTEEISETYLKKVGTCNGQVGWLGGNGRPDIAAGHSIIAGKLKDKSLGVFKI